MARYSSCLQTESGNSGLSRAVPPFKSRLRRQAGTRYFTYLEITHPADRILVVDGAALVTGRMTAKVLVAGTIVHVDNRYLAAWVREHGAWKFVAYQPTPIIDG